MRRACTCVCAILAGIMPGIGEDRPLNGEDRYTVIDLSQTDVDEAAAVELPQIRSIEAQLYNVPGIPGYLPDVNTFAIPANDYARVLAYFSKPRIDAAPRLIWPEIGSLKVTLKNGKVKRFSYYWRGGKGRLSYSVEGVRCTDGRDCGSDIDHALTLDLVLRDIYHDVTGHTVNQVLSDRLDQR